MSTFLLNVPPNRNFGDAIAVQDLRGIHVWNFVRCSPPPEPKSWRRPYLAPPNIRVQETPCLGYGRCWTILWPSQMQDVNFSWVLCSGTARSLNKAEVILQRFVLIDIIQGLKDNNFFANYDILVHNSSSTRRNRNSCNLCLHTPIHKLIVHGLQIFNTRVKLW